MQGLWCSTTVTKKQTLYILLHSYVVFTRYMLYVIASFILQLNIADERVM